MKYESKDLRNSILNMPRVVKQLIVVFVDMFLCCVSVLASFFLRLDAAVVFETITFLPVFLSIILALPVFLFFGLYREIFRFSGLPALISVSKSVFVYSIGYSSIVVLISLDGVPRAIGIIQPILLLIMLSASRLLAGSFLDENSSRLKSKKELSSVLIYGAGVNGRQLADGLSQNTKLKAVGFIDDDKKIQNQVLNGLPIHSPATIPNLLQKDDIQHVFLAITNATQERRNQIIDYLENFNVSVRTLPSFSQLANGKVSISDLRELDINDLLGRKNVSPIQSLMAKDITSKVVLVTGAGGSIGSELCRQIVTLKPKTLILVEQSEFSLYSIHQELEGIKSVEGAEIIPIIASVQDETRMTKIISSWLPTNIFHAAAYKHVPLVEQNLLEGVKNNVFGTLNIVKLAHEFHIENMVLISSDKAVRPTNAMGASKRMSELCLQAMAQENTQTKFSIVRFGNVLDSSGSVVPRFRKQIKHGGPITLTHEDVTRFFMTITEAAQLVIQAAAMADRGEIFVLDMGEPVKIKSLAQKMIQLSGLKVRDVNNLDGDIEISVIGLRPGEKLFEELLIEDNAEPTVHPRIMKGQDEFISWRELKVELQLLMAAVNDHDYEKIREVLCKNVEGYAAERDIHDHLFKQHLAKTSSQLIAPDKPLN